MTHGMRANVLWSSMSMSGQSRRLFSCSWSGRRYYSKRFWVENFSVMTRLSHSWAGLEVIPR